MAVCGVDDLNSWFLRNRMILLDHISSKYFDGERDVAEVVIQDSYLKAYSFLERKPQDFGYFPAWIYRITINTAITELGRRKRERGIFLDRTKRDYSGNGEFEDRILSEIDFERGWGDVERGLEELPPNWRIYVEMWCDGCTYEQIARVCSTREGNVKSGLHRAVKRELRLKLRLRNSLIALAWRQRQETL